MQYPFRDLTTRRTFLRASGVLSGIAVSAGGLLHPAYAESGRWVYSLTADCSSATRCHHPQDIGVHDCNSCKQCISHAANKRWSNASAVWRAHPCCRCTMTKSSVSKNEFEQLFGKGKQAVAEFDARRS